MSTAQRGRHTEGFHRSPTEGRARTTVHGLRVALRRPIASAAVILAVAGSAAARTPDAAPAAPDLSLTASPMAAAHGTFFSDAPADSNIELVAARDLSAQRAPVVAHNQLVAERARRQKLVAARAAMDRARAGAAKRVARAHARQGLIARAQSDPRAVGRLMVAERGWSGEQFACLDSLWTKESGWSWRANNSGSGAYGIPQSLPGSKMASAGSDWATNPVTQISWGLRYVASSYGTPCSAWAHSQSMNWY